MSISQNKHPKITKICESCQSEYTGTTRAHFCESCRKTRHKQQRSDWAKEHRSHMNELNGRWRAQNLDKARNSTRRSMQKIYWHNPVVHNQKTRQYYQDSREAVLKQKQEHHIKNRDKINAYTRQWREQNPEKTAANNLRLRSREPVDPELIKFVFLAYDYECMYCHAKRHLSLEHILPLTRGGDSSFENLGVACKPCNSSKRDKTVVEFMAWRQKLTAA